MRCVAVAVLVLVTMGVLGAISVHGIGLADAVTPGTKFIYVLETHGASGIDKAFYRVTVMDKFVSSDVYFNISYVFTNGESTIINSSSVTSYELNQYVPSILDYERVQAEASRKITLSIPVPMGEWNPLVEGSGPLAYKTVDLKISSIKEYETNAIGGENLSIKVYLCSGSSSKYSISAIIERYSGLLVDLKLYDSKTGELQYHLYLTYTNIPKEVILEKGSEASRWVPVVSVFGLGVAGIVLVYVLLSRVARNMAY